MSVNRRALGIIPARGGSVGVPRKNLRPLGGVPLIARAIESARRSRLLSRTIVTTEDEEIASVARHYGADVPFQRPKDLSLASSRVFDVIRHALAAVESQEGVKYDDAVLLQPTCPLRVPDDIDTCLQALWSSDADSVITVYRHPQIHPRIMYTVDGDGAATPVWRGSDRMLQREQLEPVFIRAGIVYAFRCSLVRQGSDIYGDLTIAVEIPYDRAIGIDDATDLAVCEALFNRVANDGATVGQSPESLQWDSYGTGRAAHLAS